MPKQMDIPRFRQRAYRKKKVLAAFLKKIGRKAPRGIVALAHAADTEMWKEVDCLSCANCCKTMTPTWKKSEVKRVAKHVGMSYQAYYDKYLYIDEHKDLVNIQKPCQHLGKDNKCSVYAIRPADCSGFPHHTKKDFAWQCNQKTYTNNLHRCPATLLFVEKLYAKLPELH